MADFPGVGEGGIEMRILAASGPKVVANVESTATCQVTTQQSTVRRASVELERCVLGHCSTRCCVDGRQSMLCGSNDQHYQCKESHENSNRTRENIHVWRYSVGHNLIVMLRVALSAVERAAIYSATDPVEEFEDVFHTDDIRERTCLSDGNIRAPDSAALRYTFTRVSKWIEGAVAVMTDTITSPVGYRVTTLPEHVARSVLAQDQEFVDAYKEYLWGTTKAVEFFDNMFYGQRKPTTYCHRQLNVLWSRHIEGPESFFLSDDYDDDD